MTWRGPAAAAVAAMLATAACSTEPKLTASWYLNYPEAASERAANSADPIKASSSDADVLVVLLNRGTKSAEIDTVALNRHDRKLVLPQRKGGQRSLDPGEALILRTGTSFKRGGSAKACVIPVRLYVGLGDGKASPRRVEITGAMPSSLPAEWLAHDGCARLDERAAGAP